MCYFEASDLVPSQIVYVTLNIIGGVLLLFSFSIKSTIYNKEFTFYGQVGYGSLTIFAIQYHLGFMYHARTSVHM